MLEQFDTDLWLKKFQLSEFPEPKTIFLNNPVLLCHGYGAIASLVKPSPLYDVAMLLRSHNVLSFAPNIVPYATIEIRARSWQRLIHQLTEEQSLDKVNIIAHSMGGLDIRYALAKLDIAPKVASFTSISTPHHGTSLAELTLRTPDTIRNKLADFLDWIGGRIYPHTQSDSVGSAAQLTRSYVSEQFNPAIKDIPGIPYYSYSAAVGEGTSEPIKVMSRYQNSYVYEQEGLNDGMVSVESAKWGQHIKTTNISHLEQMNLRVKEERQPLFNAFWLEIAEMLAEKGH